MYIVYVVNVDVYVVNVYVVNVYCLCGKCICLCGKCIKKIKISNHWSNVYLSIFDVIMLLYFIYMFLRYQDSACSLLYLTLLYLTLLYRVFLDCVYLLNNPYWNLSPWFSILTTSTYNHSTLLQKTFDELCQLLRAHSCAQNLW